MTAALEPIGTYGPPDPVAAPISAYRYLDARRQVRDAQRKARPLMRLWDKRHDFIGRPGNELSVSAEELLHDTGTGDIEIMGDDWIVPFLREDVRADEDLHLTIDPYPENRSWRWRYGAKVTNVRVKRDKDGQQKVTLEVSHNREHWKHLLLAATPVCAPEVQPLKAFLMPANCRTGVTITGFVNLARNYWPPLAIVDNLLNPGAWITASDVGNLNPLNWPVQMQFVNPLLDQSRFTVLMSRWSDAHSVTKDIMKDAGCALRAYTWLPEDEDSPHPELAAIVGQEAARPGRACVVLACEDKSGVTGPTGTVVDGVVNLIAATGDDLITETLYTSDPEWFDKNGDGKADPFIRKILGVAPKRPAITLRDHDQSAIISSERSMVKSKAQSITTGGKSPGWVNQSITFGIRYMLSQIGQARPMVTGPASVSTVQAPQTEGLDNIYQGQFDNMLLAYMRHTDVIRVLRSGPYGYLDHFESGAGSAYTVSSTLSLRQGLWKTRPYQSFKVQVHNGRPHTLYYDFDLGDEMLFEIDGILYRDQLSAIRLHYDENTPKTYDLSIGDDTEMQDPLAGVVSNVQMLWNGVALAFGSADLV